MEAKNKKAFGKRYDEQFKKDTVDHWISTRKPVSEVAEAFEVSETTLYKWRRKYEFDESAPGRSMESELIRLRKENTELRQERDILPVFVAKSQMKKSVAIFLKPQK